VSRRRRSLVLAALLALPLGVGPADASHTQGTCRADPPGGHDPKAQINFTARLTDNGRARTQQGKTFDFGSVRDITIGVRWERMPLPARQRVELYGPDGQLYQMYPLSLTARPDPVSIVLPVKGTAITAISLAGTWCAKIFLDDDLEPVAAEEFELQFAR